ncbi:hypothetical protein [Methylobacterium organophilum]|uniref:Uncharacterized protein n=1 Tax=Methylobacterium organophilum TaxID=410 RepID=A0ABQ4TGB5_METOR|nr:hypothetical protein [Methylobacterium organophilum]GJE29794.1 hypothetical protein LKMONMHP_4680 [Methylobacterium organophilum]
MRSAALAFTLAPILIWIAAPRPSLAAEPFLAVVLACPAGVEAPDCSRDNASDMLVQPAGQFDCLHVGEVLATRLGLAPGERHKILCERRKG